MTELKGIHIQFINENQPYHNPPKDYKLTTGSGIVIAKIGVKVVDNKTIDLLLVKNKNNDTAVVQANMITHILDF